MRIRTLLSTRNYLLFASGTGRETVANACFLPPKTAAFSPLSIDLKFVVIEAPNPP